MTLRRENASGSENYVGDFVTFTFRPELTSKTGKTHFWQVANGAIVLGCVKWFARWRKYAFFPAPETVFEQVCLRDIAQFCEDRTREQRTSI